MPIERFFVENLSPQVLLEGEEHHHLARVMRLKVGNKIELTNGKGSLAIAQIDKIDKNFTVLTILEEKKIPEPFHKIILAQAIPRQNHLDFIIEKGTELGVWALWLFPGEWSEKREMSSSQLERCKKLAKAALKQCGRLFLPEIVLLGPLKVWKPPEYVLFGDIHPEAQKLSSLALTAKKELVFFIGPEKGFSPQEEALLAKWGQGVSLHTNILRTETAAICALAQLHLLLM